ncbi:hypothetical protein SPRG_10153 [Saprolegnia parasitica CBS 223.65]|uniref:START domain-containing protein n=1 Tax=Saprolegnia parasitica (strain CBS 223.65) TaxID=695850 RepID=A0A067CDK4_SAPPC|nr:hypothetical protein SPRG_10153 [Saprolegnia parasitica CBS 223.65]KDO24621.1 hypothetical protein SPRG_10153 [Saprolegnia parasitica CBS 223.65]|eukprot:XP_012204689.1 hypothetical protein SPRG_10153 [Saprolegnia parasitica CBS 223.65]
MPNATTFPMDPIDQAGVTAMATDGLTHLIRWAQQTPEGKLLPKTATWTYEACRHVVDLAGVGTLDDIIRVYEEPSDGSSLHFDKSRLLLSLQKTRAMRLSLRWGLFRAPWPFMRDRCATYLECSKTFIDAHGRRGYARYIRSHPTTAAHHNYVSADVRSWGVVVVETAEPGVFTASSTVDIDWKGTISSTIATRMTSKRAQSIARLGAVVRAALHKAPARCSSCNEKPLKVDGQLVLCHLTKKVVCSGCRVKATSLGQISLASDKARKRVGPLRAIEARPAYSIRLGSATRTGTSAV